MPMLNHSVDTAANIATYLEDGLDGLHRLMADRMGEAKRLRETGAYYPLKEWVLLGQWFARGDGSIHRAELSLPGEGKEFVLGRLIAPVVEWEELGRIFPSIFMSSTGFSLPTSGDRCTGCQEPFDLKTLHLVQSRRPDLNEIQYEHKICAKIRRNIEARTFFEQIFKDASISPVTMNETPNQYWGSRDDVESWFNVQTRRGVILIGWRKRVINIDWSGCEVPKGALDKIWTIFEAEKVTQGDTYIHAWGREKAVEYLQLLQTALKI